MDEMTRIAKLQPPEGRVRLVIDTDTYNEIDDQFAIVHALLSPDRLAGRDDVLAAGARLGRDQGGGRAAGGAAGVVRGEAGRHPRQQQQQQQQQSIFTLVTI